METSSLIISIVQNPALSRLSDYLLIEQEPWARDIGKVTRLNLIKALEAVIFAGDNADSVDCGLIDGQRYTTLVYVYPSRDDLAFAVGLTNGSYTEPTIIDVLVKEPVSFNLTDVTDLTYPVKTVLSSSWAADVWDEAGDVITIAPPVVDGLAATVEQKIYGTAYIEYITRRFVYSVIIPARTDEPENVFQSYFYAWWDGGILMEALTAPDAAEYGYANNVSCRGGLSNLIVPPDEDPDDTPKAVPVDKTITLNYCDDF